MPEFIIYRNEGRDHRPVARVEAGSAEEACRRAASTVATGPGQTLSAEPADVADAREAERNRTSRDLARDTRGGEGPIPED